MSAYFDAARVNQLQDVMGADARAIVGGMLASMTEAIEAIESALAAEHFDRATQAAHTARNDALMLGARQLQEALTSLEAATRGEDSAGALAALERLRVVWPPTRDELSATANPP